MSRSNQEIRKSHGRDTRRTRLLAASVAAAMLLLLSVAGAPAEQPGQITPQPPPAVGGGGSSTVDPAALPTPEGPWGQSRRARVVLGDRNQVLLYAGEFTHEVVDFTLPGVSGFGLQWRRTYRSRLDYEGRLGYGWVHAYDESLQDWGNGYATHHDDRGDSHEFRPIGGNVSEGDYMRMTPVSGGGFDIRDGAGVMRRFGPPDSTGLCRLMSLTNRGGAKITLHRNSAGRLQKIVDTLGRTTWLYYFSTGRLLGIVDPNGRAWRYAYASNGTLTLVAWANADGAPPQPANDPSLVTSSYEYTAVGRRMTRHLLPEGERFTCAYQPTGELSAHGRGAGAWTITWTSSWYERTAHVTDRNGNRTDYVMGGDGSSDAGHLREIRQETNRNVEPADPAVYVTSFDYLTDPQGLGTYSKTTLPDGREVWRLYDKTNSDPLARGNIREERIEPTDSSTPERSWFIYEPQYQQLKYSVPPRAFESGQFPLTTGPRPELDVDDPYVLPFLTEHVFDYEEIEDGIDYNGDGALGPDRGLIVLTLDPGGSTALQVETRRIYNVKGQLLEEVDPTGARTRYFYWPAGDPFGRKAGSVPVSAPGVSGGLVARVVEDYSEDPEAIDSDTGNPHLNLTTTTRYDARGFIESVTNPRGFTTLYGHDALGRLVHESLPGPTPHDRIHEVDLNGREVGLLEENLRADGSTDPDNPWFERRWTYNQVDQIVSEQAEVADGDFLVTQYAHDRNGNLVLIMSPRAVSGDEPAAVQSFVYDERDQVHTHTRGGYTTQFGSLAAHSHIDLFALGVGTLPQPSTTAYRYDPAGATTSITDPQGDVTTIVPDGFAREGERHYPDGSHKELDYDLDDEVVEERTYDPWERLTSWRQTWRDERSLPTLVREGAFVWTNPPPGTMTPLTTDGNGDGIVANYRYYDEAGREVVRVDDRLLLTFSVRDGAGRVVRRTEPWDEVVAYERDANGNVTAIERQVPFPGGAIETFVSEREYDSLDRVTRDVDILGNEVTYEYASLGDRTAVVDALGNRTTRVFDGFGRVRAVSTELREGGTGAGALLDVRATLLEYDDNGNLEEVLDGEERRLSIVNDALDREQSRRFGSENARSVTYEVSGRIHEVTEGNGTRVRYAYDDAGHLVSETVLVLGSGVDGLVTQVDYEVDEAGRVIHADNGPCEVDRTYDSFGRLVSETLTDSSGSWTTTAVHDGSGNLLQLTYPGGLVVDYAPGDDLDETAEIWLDGVLAATFDHAGERIVERNVSLGGPSTLSTWTNDDADRLFRIMHKTFSTPAQTRNLYFGRDANGRKTAVLRLHEGLGDQYFHDSLGQLVRTRYDVAGAQLGNPQAPAQGVADTWYDLAGNRLATDVDGVVTLHQINELNQVSAVGAIPLAYDASGNLLGGGGKTFVYDYAHRLRKVIVQGNLVAEYHYDPLGRRYRRVATGSDRRSVWFGNRLLEVRRANPETPAVTQLVYGRELDDAVVLRSDGVSRLLLRDDLGSTTHVVAADGGVIEQYEYDAWGVPTIRDGSGNVLTASAIGNPSLYTGREWDAAARLHHLRARDYSPDLGRFLNRDPIGLRGGINPYVYVGNDPMNTIDPMGTTDWDYFVDRADPTGELQRAMAVADVDAVVAGIGSFVSFGLKDLVGGLGPGMKDLAHAAQDKIDAWMNLLEAVGPVAVKFMDTIVAVANSLTAAVDTLRNAFDGDGSAAGSYSATLPNGQDVTIEYSGGADGSANITFDDGTQVTVYSNGDMDGTVPAGEGRHDTFSYDSDTGTYTYTTADGVTLERFANGNTAVTLANGDKFVYDDKGKLIKHCKPGEECPEATPGRQKEEKKPEPRRDDDPPEDN